MSRYRLALLALLAAVAAALLYVGFVHSAPPSVGMTGSAALIPEEERQAAPELTGLDGWVNSSPLTIAGLRGHVVLVDFWTFSCVNCVRTIPHLAHFEQAYGSAGLVIVGVHSPEFDFERVPANVRAAVSRLGVSWPVALDGEMHTWNAYGNQYWPAEYLVDQSGKVALIHDGEGDYETTESAIASLLGVPVAGRGPVTTAIPNIDVETPELYAGSDRQEPLAGESRGSKDETTSYPDPGPPTQANAIQVTGSWADEGQYMVSRGPGHVRLRFTANNVFLVVGSDSSSPVSTRVTVDGYPVSGADSGADLDGSQLSVSALRLYAVLTEHGGAGSHLIDIEVPAGLRLYTFTFG